MDKKRYKGVLAIDFDDTIAKTKFPYIEGAIEGAKEYINNLYMDGWYIIIWTCRCDDNVDVKPLTIAKDYLASEGINYHKINEHNDHLVRVFGNNTRKIAADFYIDDKNLFGLPSWSKVYEELSKFNSAKSCLRYGEEELIEQ